MNTNLTSRSICALVLGGCTAVASALSIGPVTGSTVVGRPLELVAPIQFDEPAPGNASGCVSAEVRYGDKLLDRARVQVELGGDAARRTSYARISSASPVDEPFVTIVLYAGCGRQSSRRYVMLSEAPKEDPLALAAASVLGVKSITQPLPAKEAAVAQSRAVRPVRPVHSTQVDGASPAAAPLFIRRIATEAREAAPRSGGVLKLAVWDPGSEQLPWLRASTELKSSPTTDGAHRAAATSLWRALNAQPQDLLRTAERLRGLESEMGSLRSLSARHRAEISSARESLQSAQSQRHTSLLVVTLLALLTGSAAAVVFHRSRRPPQATAADSWYAPIEPLAGAQTALKEQLKPPPFAEIPMPVVPGVAARTPLVEVAGKPTPIEIPRPGLDSPMLATVAYTLPEAPVEPVPVVQAAIPPGLKIDALHGAQQQSEFFASLGQIDEAVAVLASYLEESSERPVLAFLELFRVYHGTGMREQYEDLQSTFRKTFGMDVASFGEYKDEDRELEQYLLPVTRIASAWPSERSQEIIEELLFKRPATPRDLLSLEAYRELLWLYSLGQEIVHNTATPAGIQLVGDRGLPNDHFILPWAVAEPQDPGELSLDRLDKIDVAPELNAFAVDIDLTAMRAEVQPVNQAVKAAGLPPTPPQNASAADLDAFDAVMESASRRHFR